MYGLPRTPDPKEGVAGRLGSAPSDVWSNPRVHKARIYKELKQAGLSTFAEFSPEFSYIHLLVHSDEHIGGAVFGRSQFGLSLMVATEKRVIFLDKKPLYVNDDEYNYHEINGLSMGQGLMGATVTVHTRVEDIKMRTHNVRAAEKFNQFVQERCFDQGQQHSHLEFDQS